MVDFLYANQNVFDFIEGDDTTWEKEPMETIAREGQMFVTFKHSGFWKPMDTLRDKHELEADWISGKSEMEELVTHN